jgi:hypothetical protein
VQTNINTFLSKSWIFRFSSLAFIILGTPTLAVFTHGDAGFFLITAFVISVGIVENSLIKAIHKIFEGVSRNKLLFFLIFWYGAGVFFNSIIRGRGFADWAYFLPNIIFLLGTCFVFAFIRSPDGFRIFQIGYILVSGIQSIFIIRALLTMPGIARTMFLELGGGWLYGDQSAYALYVILSPIFFWRAFREKGLLRVLLFISSSTILISAILSSFGTPIGLLLLGVIIITFLSILFMLRKKGMAIALVIIIAAFLGYQYTQHNAYLISAYSRIINVFQNPMSGGYSGGSISSSRWYKAETSIDSFVNNPLFGSGGGNIRYSEVVGGHSSFFDSLGAYGLLGGGGALVGIMVIFLVNAFFRFIRQRNWETLTSFVCVILLVVAGIVNPYWEGFQPLFVFIMARPILID